MTRSPAPKTIAVMQPYFVPYRGYFRLFEEADLVVLYDCVQFPRRGFVHRNRLADAKGEPAWLTLPLAKAPREALICDLEFAADAEAVLRRRARRFPVLRPLLEDEHNPWGPLLFDLSGAPVDYIAGWLEACCGMLDIPFKAVRSSTLRLAPELKGQDRILAICRELGATRYVNAPGGRELYNADAFQEAGIELKILDEYHGSNLSILYRLLSERPKDDFLACSEHH